MVDRRVVGDQPVRVVQVGEAFPAPRNSGRTPAGHGQLRRAAASFIRESRVRCHLPTANVHSRRRAGWSPAWARPRRSPWCSPGNRGRSWPLRANPARCGFSPVSNAARAAETPGWCGSSCTAGPGRELAQVRRRDLRPERADVAEAHVIQEHHDDVGRAGRRGRGVFGHHDRDSGTVRPRPARPSPRTSSSRLAEPPTGSSLASGTRRPCRAERICRLTELTAAFR